MDLRTQAPPEPATALTPARPGVWAGFGIVVLYLALQVVVSIAVGAAMSVALSLRDGARSATFGLHPNVHAASHLLRTNPDLRAVLVAVTVLVSALVVAAVIHRAWPAQWSRADAPGFGFTPPADNRVFAAAVALGIAVPFVGGLLTTALAHGHPFHQNIVQMARATPVHMRLLLAFAAVCVAPVIEELIFRGVLLSGLARRMRMGWAIVITAIVFGCAHLPDFGFVWYPLPELVLLGLVLAWLRVKSRSLWPAITVHATFNFIAMTALFIAATRL